MRRANDPPTAILKLGVAAIFAVLFLSVGTRGLFETSEGRYGSIAAEMARTNDYLVPRINGAEHFEKPPLATWAMALSLELFGESEEALRVPGLLAALIAVVFAGRLAGGWGTRRGGLAVLLTLACPLFLCMAQAATTDIYLAAASAGTLSFALRALDPDLDPAAREQNLTRATLVSALGFMVKGPVIWILTLLPLVLELTWSRRGNEIAQLFRPRRILAFFGVVLPWFILVGVRVPGLLAWFVRERSVGALVSSAGFHKGPIYYYAPIFLAGLLPAAWIVLSLGRDGSQGLFAQRKNRLLLLAVVVPLTVFSLSASKLGTYPLPLAVPTAALAAAGIEAGRGRRGLELVSGLLVLGVPVLGFLVWHKGSLSAVPRSASLLLGACLAFLVLGSIAALWLSRRGRLEVATRTFATSTIAAVLFLAPAFGLAESEVLRAGSGRDVARAIQAYAGADSEVVGYKVFVRSLPFYLGRNVRLAEWSGIGQSRIAGHGEPALDQEQFVELLGREYVVVFCRSKDVPEVQALAGPLREEVECGRYVILSNLDFHPR